MGRNDEGGFGSGGRTCPRCGSMGVGFGVCRDCGWPGPDQNEVRRAQEANERDRRRPQAAARHKAARQEHATSRSDSILQESKSKSVKARRKPEPTEKDDWNTGFAVIAFLVAGIWAANSVDEENMWLAGLFAGIFAAYIAGRFYKAIIALGVIGLGFWIWAVVKQGQ